MNFVIRNERASDVDAIAQLTRRAFQKASHSSGTEQLIVNALRRRGKLALSLVAVEGNEIIGHIAFSPVTISTGATGWYGLAPLSVIPERQRQGVGTQLVQSALTKLTQQGACGCVVLGDPGYYSRFGFVAHNNLVLPGVPPEYFQASHFQGEVPTGYVSYDEAFEAKE